ncbi:mitochondrial import receptor subunit Tom22 [Coemansia sp. RSA 2610]|nr:mitochondrial import receptor subunit Tom22 [Coemansia sp. RSA 2610]
MVKLVEIENEYESDSQYTTDSESLASDSEHSDYESDVEDESLLERLAALKDIVPAQQRQTIASVASSAKYWGEFGARLVGKLSWVFTTSALLVVFPLALETDRDKMMQEWAGEQQQQGQPQEGGMMAPPPPGMGAPGMAGPAPGLA